MPSPKRKFNRSSVEKRFHEKSKLAQIVSDPNFQLASAEWLGKAGLLREEFTPHEVAQWAMENGLLPREFVAEMSRRGSTQAASVLMAAHMLAVESGDPAAVAMTSEFLSRCGMLGSDGSLPGDRFMRTALQMSDPDAVTARQGLASSKEHFDGTNVPRTVEGFLDDLSATAEKLGAPLPRKELEQFLGTVRAADLADELAWRSEVAAEEARVNEPPSMLESLEEELVKAKKDAGGGSVEGMARAVQLEGRLEQERRIVKDREDEVQGRSASRAAMEVAYDTAYEALQPTKSKLRKELDGMLATGDIDYATAHALNEFLEETSTETIGISEESDEGKFRLMEAWKREEERAAISQGELPPMRTEVVIPDFETKGMRKLRESGALKEPDAYTERLRAESDREGRAESLSEAWDTLAVAHGEPTMTGQTPGSEPEPAQSAGSDDIRSHLEAAYDRAFGSEKE